MSTPRWWALHASRVPPGGAPPRPTSRPVPSACATLSPPSPSQVGRAPGGRGGGEPGRVLRGLLRRGRDPGRGRQGTRRPRPGLDGVAALLGLLHSRPRPLPPTAHAAVPARPPPARPPGGGGG